jgi:hypothetical protein
MWHRTRHGSSLWAVDADAIDDAIAPWLLGRAQPAGITAVRPLRADGDHFAVPWGERDLLVRSHSGSFDF